MKISIKKKIAYGFFIISALLFVAFIRQQILVANSDVWQGTLIDYECKTRYRGDLLTVYLREEGRGIIRYAKAGQACFKFNDIEKYIGSEATIETPKGSNMILQFDVGNKEFINKKISFVIGFIGLCIIIGMFIIIGIVILKSLKNQPVKVLGKNKDIDANN